MSEGSLSLDNHVVVTRGTGRYYVSKQRADNLVTLLNSQDCPRIIKIGDDHIAASDIVGVVSAVQVEDMEKRRRGMWQCGKGNWHNRDEVCKCGWGDTQRKEKEKEVEENQTPEQKERASLIRQLREAGLGFRDFKKMSGKTNAQLGDMLKDMQAGKRI